VPVILIDEAHQKCRLNQGSAIDVAPTVLRLLGLSQPAEMTGHSLIVES
jgi:2,3-bisphosphoglycerate-independent phosphoglycerate mutase